MHEYCLFCNRVFLHCEVVYLLLGFRIRCETTYPMERIIGIDSLYCSIGEFFMSQNIKCNHTLHKKTPHNIIDRRTFTHHPKEYIHQVATMAVLYSSCSCPLRPSSGYLFRVLLTLFLFQWMRSEGLNQPLSFWLR